jgi:hypothetical protein
LLLFVVHLNWQLGIGYSFIFLCFRVVSFLCCHRSNEKSGICDQDRSQESLWKLRSGLIRNQKYTTVLLEPLDFSFLQNVFVCYVG